MSNHELTPRSETAGPQPRIRIRTPHVTTLLPALDARDHLYERIASDTVRVHGVSADDLGWLAAETGVVIYEMSVDPPVGGPL